MPLRIGTASPHQWQCLLRHALCLVKMCLFPDDLHHRPLAARPVRLPVKDLLPGPEIQLAYRDREYDMPPMI